MKQRLYLLIIIACTIGIIGCCSTHAPSGLPAYSVETIETPNGLSVETGGLDFLSDGRLVACFRRGEVLFHDPNTGDWSLFARGLQDPLGNKAVSDTELLVMQRSELTKLVDRDGDGSADLYKTVTDDFGMSGHYHEFAFGPEKDKNGGYYIALNVASNLAGVRDMLRGEFNELGRPGRMFSAVPYRGWVMKVTADGQTIPWASGLRSPNGLEVDTEGNLFITDNQGIGWVQVNFIISRKIIFTDIRQASFGRRILRI